MDKIRWGILSTAGIGIRKVIPALQRGQFCTVTAIASRDVARAEAAGRELGIATVHPSYEALLADPAIDAVYIPLPNHLHVPWSIKALAAGKHVLCEKPLGLTARDAELLLAASHQHPHLKIMEAFMYRNHPQWEAAQRIVAAGGIGTLRTIQSFFSYWNVDPNNIRNHAEMGGGALMDIGCYCVSFSRFLFAAEPTRMVGWVDRDPTFGTDRITSGMLEFPGGSATFTCSTQLSPYQRVNIFGTEGRIEIEIPVNAPPDRRCRLWHQRGTAIIESTFDVCDQYTLQGDRFARAILDHTPVLTPLDDAVENLRVIEALFESARRGTVITRSP